MYQIKGSFPLRASSGCLIYMIYMIGFIFVMIIIGSVVSGVFAGILTPAFYNGWGVIPIAIGTTVLLVVYSIIFKRIFFSLIRCVEKRFNRKIEVEKFRSW